MTTVVTIEKMNGRYHMVEKSVTHNSDVFQLPYNYTSVSVSISNVSSGSVTLQYSLSSTIDTNTIWIDSSILNVTADESIHFSNPIKYLRFIGDSNSATYTIQIMVNGVA